MVKRNIPISRELDYDCDPTCPSYQQDILSAGVNSLNGLQGDILLKKLIAGDKSYNGSSDVEITAADLGLLKALRYEGSRTKKQLDNMHNVPVGNLYFCTDNKLYYLSVGEGDWRHLLSGTALDSEISERKEADTKLQIEIDGIKLSLSDVLKAIDLHEGRISKLEAQSGHWEGDLEKIWKKLNTHDLDIEKLKINVENLGQRQAVFDLNLNKLTKRIDSQEEKISKHDEEIKATLDRMTSAESRLSVVENISSENSKNITKIYNLVDIVTDDVSDLKTKVNNLEYRQVVLDKKVTDIIKDVEEIKPEIEKIPVIEKISKEAIEKAEKALEHADYAKDKVDGLNIRVSNLEYRQVVTDHRLEKLERDTVQKITTVDEELTVDENNNITLSRASKSKYGLVKLGNEFIDEEDVLTINEVSTDKIIQGNKSILIQAIDE